MKACAQDDCCFAHALGLLIYVVYSLFNVFFCTIASEIINYFGDYLEFCYDNDSIIV